MLYNGSDTTWIILQRINNYNTRCGEVVVFRYNCLSKLSCNCCIVMNGICSIISYKSKTMWKQLRTQNNQDKVIVSYTIWSKVVFFGYVDSKYYDGAIHFEQLDYCVITQPHLSSYLTNSVQSSRCWKCPAWPWWTSSLKFTWVNCSDVIKSFDEYQQDFPCNTPCWLISFTHAGIRLGTEITYWVT